MIIVRGIAFLFSTVKGTFSLPVASYLCVTSSAEETFSGLKPGETAVMFRVPEFAVAPGIDSQGRPLSEKGLDPQPPGESLFDCLVAPFTGSSAWRFQLRKPLIVENDASDPGNAGGRTAALAIDFGTSATTVAYLRSTGMATEGNTVAPPINLLPGLLPWTHCTVSQRLKRKLPVR